MSPLTMHNIACMLWEKKNYMLSDAKVVMQAAREEQSGFIRCVIFDINESLSFSFNKKVDIIILSFSFHGRVRYI